MRKDFPFHFIIQWPLREEFHEAEPEPYFFEVSTTPEMEFVISGTSGTSVKYFWARVKFSRTRSYAALRAADLDWIIGPGYSLDGYILEKNHEKTTWNHEKP